MVTANGRHLRKINLSSIQWDKYWEYTPSILMLRDLVENVSPYAGGLEKGMSELSR